MSFVGGYTQTEIADRIGASQAKVHRLIDLAHKSGLIRIHIEGRPLECLELEDQVSKRFKLANCIVAPSFADHEKGEDAAIAAVGAAAGPYLHNILTSKKIRQVGVGMGRTISAAVDAFPAMSRDDLNIVAVSGSLTRKLTANPYDVIQKFQAQTGGDGYFLPVPYLARTREEKAMFHNQDSVRELLIRARNSDVFVIGIGSLGDDSHFARTRMLAEMEQAELNAKGAAADLMGRFINPHGQLIETELGEKAVGLHYEEVRGSRVIALAGGASKAEATVAALLSGIITEIIMDESLAKKVAQLAEAPKIRLVEQRS